MTSNFTKSFFVGIVFFSSTLVHAQVRSDAVDDFAREFAKKYNKKAEDITNILSNARYDESIIKKMERPAESMPWFKYRDIFMKEDRISAGVEFWKDHELVLSHISRSYGIPPEIILGILGVETYFGQRKGDYRVLDALFTLSFHYPKRAKFFRSELENFLLLLDEEKLEVDGVLGSYAGAIGYCQFMPSSYRAYAKSFEDNDQRDLTNSSADAMESIANYLKVHKWQNGGPIAIKIAKRPGNETSVDKGIRPRQKLSYFLEKGFQPVIEMDDQERAALVELELPDQMESWFVFNNFYVITRYNHSPLYAMAVFQLSEEIKKKKESQ